MGRRCEPWIVFGRAVNHSLGAVFENEIDETLMEIEIIQRERCNIQPRGFL